MADKTNTDDAQDVIIKAINKAVAEMLEPAQEPAPLLESQFSQLGKRFFELEGNFGQLAEQFEPLP